MGRRQLQHRRSAAALALLLRPGLGKHDLLGHSFQDPWLPSNWQVCIADVQLVLRTLASSQRRMNVSS